MPSVRSVALLVFVIGATAACSESVSAGLDDDSAIREAVFRYQFGHYKSYLGEETDFYCFGTARDSDLPPQLMRRFGNLGIPVVPASECKVTTKVLGTIHVDGEVTHKNLKGLGLILMAGEIRRLDAEKVEVDGGYYGNGKAASGNTYVLRMVGGRWQVVEDRENWVS